MKYFSEKLWSWHLAGDLRVEFEPEHLRQILTPVLRQSSQKMAPVAMIQRL